MPLQPVILLENPTADGTSVNGGTGPLVITHSSCPWLFVRTDEVDRALVWDRWLKVVIGDQPTAYPILTV